MAAVYDGDIDNATLYSVDELGEGLFESINITKDDEFIRVYLKKSDIDLVIEKIDLNGCIIADNVLWSGKVTKKESEQDLETKALNLYNKKVLSDARVETILLPVRDGLMICRKIKN